MGMPTDPILDIMRRSMANLAFVEAHAGSKGPYEVTQLINTFLSAFMHPFEAMQHDLMARPLQEAAAFGWPTIKKESPSDNEPASLGDLVRLMRNSVAHGNIEFLPDGENQIKALRIWNTRPHGGPRNWGAIVTVDDMRMLLDHFVELVEIRHRDFGWYIRSVA